MAQRIANVAVINEDPKTRLIRQLRAQVKFLMEQLKHSRQVFVSGGGNSNGIAFILFNYKLDLKIEVKENDNRTSYIMNDANSSNYNENSVLATVQKVDNNVAMRV